MAEFLQIVLINLVVSCDNIGVITLATRNLPEQKAIAARRAGIGLSIVLKIIFIAIIGYLLCITWLHIRIIGGAMLLYITFQMLGEHDHESPRKMIRKNTEENNFFRAIITIIAADISMSIDNVVAILGVVSSDGHALGVREYFLVIGGLIICVPLLLWFSNKIAGLMERTPVATYICAGYLVYTAIKIISEDEFVQLFLETAHFIFIEPAAILCGVLMIIYGVLSGKARKHEQGSKANKLPLYIAVVAFSLTMVGIISYMSVIPPEDINRDVYQWLMERLQSGVSAVYLLGIESEALCFLSALLTGIVFSQNKTRNCRAMFIGNIREMIIFILLYLIITTAGVSYTFGFGNIQPLLWLANVSLLTALLLTYPAVFSIFATLAPSRTLAVLLGLLYMLIETIIAAICMSHAGLKMFAAFFPKYYLSTYALQPLNPMLAARILLIAFLYIGVSYCITDSVCKYNAYM